MNKTKRIFCIVAAFLSLAILASCVPISASAATGETQIQATIDKYYSAVSTVGIPHWNAGHSMSTLMKNADAGNYADDVTPYECSHPGGYSPKYGTCDSNHLTENSASDLPNTYATSYLAIIQHKQKGRAYLPGRTKTGHIYKATHFLLCKPVTC